MEASKGIWVMTAESETAGAVAAALRLDETFTPIRVCDNFESLQDGLKRNPTPAVLVDIDIDPSKTLSDLRHLIDQYLHTRFVVLASKQDGAMMLEAMQAGARHFLLKNTLNTDLNVNLHRLVQNGHSHPKQSGHAVTVLSASGGCGATTLIINLAHELNTLTSDLVLLVDLDTRYGAIATYLGLKGGYGVADILTHDSAIDHQLIRTTAQQHSEALDVLVSPASVRFSDSTPLPYSRLKETIDACKQAYKYTLIDAPTVSMDVAAGLSHTSTATLVVFQLTVKDIRVAREMITALSNRSVPTDQIIPVVNRYTTRGHTVSLKDATQALGGVTPRLLRNDFRSAVRGINFGEFLDQVAPRSPLRKDVRNLASELYQSHTESQHRAE